MMRIICYLLIGIISLASSALPAQDFTLVDSLKPVSFNRFRTNFFLYKKDNYIDKMYPGQKGFEFKRKNPDKFYGGKSFRNYFGSVLHVIASGDKKKKIHSVFFAQYINARLDFSIFNGTLTSSKDQIYCVVCKSGHSTTTYAIIKPDLKKVIGLFPDYFEADELVDWTGPSPVFSEVITSTTSHVGKIETIQNGGNEILIYATIMDNNKYNTYYSFSIPSKQWYKATPKVEKLPSDTSHYLGKKDLKLPTIENSPKVQEVITKLSKEQLKVKCKIDRIQAIKEEKELLFCVEYKKRCKPFFLQYNIKKKQWYKLEFEKTEIK